MKRQRQYADLPPVPAPEVVLLTLTDVCGLLQIRPRTLYDLRRKDASFARIFARIGGSQRVSRRDLDAWLTRQRQVAA